MRAKGNLLKRFKLIWVVQSYAEKYSAWPVGQITATCLRRPALDKRGASRSLLLGGWPVMNLIAFLAGRSRGNNARGALP